MTGTIFKPVSTSTGEGFKNNGTQKIVRSGNLLMFQDGKQISKAELGNGIVTEGTYIKAVPNKYNPERNDYLVRESDGTLTILAATASLDRQFANVSLNELVQVVYNGRKAIKRKTGQTASMHDFQVLTASEAATAG